MTLSSPKGKQGRPHNRDGAITRQLVIDAARSCFAQHGYEKATNKLIAQTAGLTASALYNYYPSKRDIYLAVLDDAQALLLERYQAAISGVDSPLECLCRIIDTNGQIHKQRPDLPAFLALVRFEAIRNPELQASLADHVGTIEPIVTQLVKSAQKRGELSKSVPARNIEEMLLSASTGISINGLHSDLEDHLKNLKALRKLLDGSLVTVKS